MPPKRSAASTQSPGAAQPGSSAGTSYQHPDEFTRVVKKRLSSSTRTGQACDRCKVRKIRCDGLPGGCSPCMQNRTECKTTDRISQKAVPRGYLETLEQRCANLEAKNKELQAALAAAGLEPRLGPGLAPQDHEWSMHGAKPSGLNGTFTERWRPADRAQLHQSSYAAAANGQLNSSHKLLQPAKAAGFRPASSCAHYLGISGHSYINSMRSTALSLLGIDIDLSVLDPNEPAHASGGTRTDETYGSCLASMLNVNPHMRKIELPAQEDAFQLARYFFMVSHPYLPILHKPSFLKTLELMYTDKNFTPSPAQIVCVHIIFAIVNYQNFVSDRQKNRGNITPAAKQLMESSRLHYHYALSFFYELLLNPTLEDLQAIGLILQHLRAFPKPGGSWLLSRLAISICIELGLHRSTKNWIYQGPKPNAIDVELRKRVFWSILTLEVSLASKLGRPMSIREGDYDVEYPERIDDDFIVESGFLRREDGVEDCVFDVAIEMFKCTALCIEIQSTLYGTIRPPRDKYVSLVEDLEGKLNKWRDNAPKSLSLDSPKPERQFHAAHLHSWYHECRILMRHPSLSLSPSPSFTNDCIRICVESSREILRLTDNLRKGSHYLDTTWYGTTVQLLATLTILFSVWDKRDTVTEEEIAQVKSDMDLCMDIMGDVGSLLGSPNRLREVVQVLTHGTMEMVNGKPEQDARRSPGSNIRLNSGPSLSSVSAAPTMATAGATPPMPSLKSSISTQSLSDQYQSPVYPVQSEARNSPNIQVFSDPMVSSANVFEHMQATNPAGGTNPLYGAGFPPSGQSSFNGSGEASQPAVFNAWGWSGNESWREYMQSISNIAGELDPSETYSASALIALNQDCNNNFLGNNSAAAAQAGSQAASALGLMGSSVPGSGGPAPSISPPPNGFSSSENAEPPWPLAINGYTYSDSAIRGVPNGTAGNGG